MATIIYSTDPKSGTLQYAETVGRKGVTWTPDRTKARRFVRSETANLTAQRIMRNGWHPAALISPEESAP